MNIYNDIGKKYINALEALDLEIKPSKFYDEKQTSSSEKKSLLQKVLYKFWSSKSYENRLPKLEYYDFLLNQLDKISLKDGKHLCIKVAERKGPGDYSSFYTRQWYYKEKEHPIFKDFKELVIPPIYPDLNIEKSEMGAWQVYLLYISYTILPLWWHANYSRRIFFFDISDDKNYKFLSYSEMEINLPTHLIQEPVVLSNDDKFIVSCSYWNDWEGLVRETVNISFLDNGNVSFSKPEKIVVFPYNCRIRF